MSTVKKATPAKKSTTKQAANGAAAAAKKSAGVSKSAANKSPAKKSAGKKSAPKKSSEANKYTDPDLRDRIKQQVIEGDKGGRAGQWSARKAQMVAHEYEAEGGAYKGQKDESQQNLTSWGDEHWTTSDGKPAERSDGMHRYLPEAAWEKLSPEERKATDQKKLREDHQGKQFVPNTPSAKRARKSAQHGS